MSTDLAVRQTPNIDEIQRVAKAYAASGYWPDTRDVAQAFVKVSFGFEVGLPAFVAMSQVHIIKGKPTLGAAAIAALVKAHPKYDYTVVEHNDERCVLEFFEDGQSLGVSEFTMEHARQADLLSNPTYKKFPRNMLFSRAMSNGQTWYCPDVTMGRVYTPEEITDADFVDNDGPVLISPAQLTRLHTIASNHGVPKEEAKRIVLEVGGVESSRVLSRDRYEQVCEALEDWQGSGPEPSGATKLSPAADAQAGSTEASASGPDGSSAGPQPPAEEGTFSPTGADGGVPGSGETVGEGPPTPADSPNEPLPFEDPPAELDVAAIAALHPPGGKRKADTLGQIVDECLAGDVDARQWLSFALRFEPWQGTEFGDALRAYLGVRVPLLVELAEEGRA